MFPSTPIVSAAGFVPWITKTFGRVLGILNWKAILVAALIVIILAFVLAWLTRRLVYVQTVRSLVADGQIEEEREIISVAKSRSGMAAWVGPALLVILVIGIILSL